MNNERSILQGQNKRRLLELQGPSPLHDKIFHPSTTAQSHDRAWVVALVTNGRRVDPLVVLSHAL